MIFRGFPSNGDTTDFSVTPNDVTSLYEYGGEFRFYKKNGTLTLQAKINDSGFVGSATLTGTPTAPTATAGTNTTQIATTAFVQENVGANTYWTKTGGDIANNNSGIVTVAGMRFGNIGSNVFADFNRYGQDISFILGNPGFQNTSIVFNNAFGGEIKASSVLKLNSTVNGLEINGTKIISHLPITAKGYTVSTLPSGTQGDTAYVTDATAPTYLGTLTGGGSVVCPVFYNGTAWVSH